METKRHKVLAEIECLYEGGDCCYKNPLNKFTCFGCRYARLIQQELKDDPQL